MKYRNLGRSGLKVSEISLGSWMTFGGVVDDEESFRCLRRAYDLGINFFDSSNAYNAGAAEEVLGNALIGLPRRSLVIATKAFFPMGPDPNNRGLSRKHLFEECEASLRRLKVDYIDLYQCHRYDEETPLEETLRALDDLQAQGKILYAGVSQWSASQIRQAADLGRQMNLRPLISNQPGYNLMSREQEGEVLPACREIGMGWVVFSPLAQGVLTGKYRPGSQAPKGSRALDKRQNMWMSWSLKKENLVKVGKMVALAKKLGLSPARLALAWCLRLPEVASVITGATRVAQVEENAKGSGVKLTPEVLEQLDQLFPAGK
jgi:voltage-dependent potassium channel beta subunit